MAKEKTTLELLEEVLKKFKTIYPNKFLIYNDSIAINQCQTPKNAGECDGTIVIHIKDEYKDAIRKSFYPDGIQENTILFIPDMNNIRSLITSSKNDLDEFQKKVIEDGCIKKVSKNSFQNEYDRILHEVSRKNDMCNFKPLNLEESSEEFKTFIENKNAISIPYKCNDDKTVMVILSADNIPLLTKKNIDHVLYYIGVEYEDDFESVYFITFYLETDMFRLFSTYHFV